MNIYVCLTFPECYPISHFSSFNLYNEIAMQQNDKKDEGKA